VPDSVTLIDLAFPVAWPPWRTGTFLLLFLSASGFLLALPGRGFGFPRWQRVSRWALLAALACALAAPLSLAASLHRPDRVMLLFTRAGGAAWIGPCYLAALTLFAWTTMLRDLAAATGADLRARLHRAASLGGGGAPRLRTLAMLLTAGFGFILLPRTHPTGNAAPSPDLATLAGGAGLAVALMVAVAALIPVLGPRRAAPTGKD